MAAIAVNEAVPAKTSATAPILSIVKADTTPNAMRSATAEPKGADDLRRIVAT